MGYVQDSTIMNCSHEHEYICPILMSLKLSQRYLKEELAGLNEISSFSFFSTLQGRKKTSALLVGCKLVHHYRRQCVFLVWY